MKFGKWWLTFLVGWFVVWSAKPAFSQAAQVFSASIGAGNVHGYPRTEYIDEMSNSAGCQSQISYLTFQTNITGGPALLLPQLPLEQKNGVWIPASITEPTMGADIVGGTTTSSIGTNGIVTSQQSAESASLPDPSQYPNSYETGTSNSIEVIDLNTGKYYWHRTYYQVDPNLGSSGCPTTALDTDTFTADLPISLSPITSGINPTLSIVNPALANGISLPFPSEVSPDQVPNTPGASGLAVDGVSAVALVFQSSSDSPVTLTVSAPGYSSGIGSITPYTANYLSSPSPGLSPSATIASPINDDACTASTGSPANNPPCIFLALLWAPASIAFNPNTGGLPTPITLMVQGVQNSSSGSQPNAASNSISLMPPPLVLVHGIWSNAAAWTPFEQWLATNYPHQMIFAADYQATDSLSFENPGTQQVLATTIANALTLAAQDGVAAQKVDVVAHSLGGLVTRYFRLTGAPPPFASSFLPAGPVHNLITIGTPHNGSALASVLENGATDTPTGTDLTIPLFCIANGLTSSTCTLSNVFALLDKPIETGIQSLEPGSAALQSLTDTGDYQSIVGLSPVATTGESYGSPTEGVLNGLIETFIPGDTVDSILGNSNDTIVNAVSQAGQPSNDATITNVVHTAIVSTDTGETGSSAVWNQAVYWLLSLGTGQAPPTGYVQKADRGRGETVQPLDTSSSSPPNPIFDLTGYTQVDGSNVSFSPASGTVLTIGTTNTIAATSTSKTISEVLLFQTVSDPSDASVLYSTQAPFGISFTPTRLGSANFEAFAVFTDNTFAAEPLSYSLQPSGNALGLSINAPVANLPIGLSVVVPAQAGFSNGLVNVTQQATYVARSGGTSVFSVGSNGSITTAGTGYDWLDVSYEGQTASAMITVGSCTYSLSPTNQIIDQSGGAATVQVTTQMAVRGQRTLEAQHG